MAQNVLFLVRRLAVLCFAFATACGSHDPPGVPDVDSDPALRVNRGLPIEVTPDTSLHALGPGEHFAAAVALSGARLAATDTAPGETAPHVDTFRIEDGRARWTGQAPRPASATNCFGWSLALLDDLLLVGDPCAGTDGSGTVQPYRWLRGAWVPEPVMEHPLAAPWAFFGATMATGSNRLVVGAEYEMTVRADGSESWGAGAAYAFRRTDGVWSFEGRLAPPEPVDWGQFGADVTLNGDTFAASELYRPGTDPASSTAVHVFAPDGRGGLRLASTLWVAETWVGEIAFCGGELVVAGLAESIRVHVFARTAAGWVEVQTLEDAGGPFAVNSSAELACDSTTMVLGFPYNSAGDMEKAGEARVYHRGLQGWYPAATITGPTPDAATARALAVDNGIVAIGSPGAMLGELNVGRLNLSRP